LHLRQANWHSAPGKSSPPTVALSSRDFELLDTTIVDNSAYWVYNRSLYHANFDNDSINKSTIKKLNNFGMDADEMHSVIKEFGKL